MLKDRTISIPSEGRCNYVLDISGFGVGVYTVEISDKQETASTAFTVGIQSSAVTASKLENSDDLKSSDGIFSFTEKQVGYNIPYSISNGVIDSMALSCDYGSLLIDVSSQSESSVNLGIELPRDVLDPKANGKDSRFAILRDGEEIDYDEIPYQDHRKLSMSFLPSTDKIEIIYSFIPELKPLMCKIADNPSYSSILPPLKQIQSGISVDEIQCKENLVLIQKYDNSPACVKPETVSKLIERGWAAEHILSLIPLIGGK